MLGQLEDAEDSQHAEDEDAGAALGDVAAPGEDDGDNDQGVGYDRHHVDLVELTAYEYTLIWAAYQAENKLNGEPEDAGRLDEKEGVGEAGHLVPGHVT